jgi:hypothetical protein
LTGDVLLYGDVLLFFSSLLFGDVLLFFSFGCNCARFLLLDL